MVNGRAGTVGVGDAAAGWGSDLNGLQQGYDLRASCGVAEADQRQCGVAANHVRRILQHFQKRVMKSCTGRVLPHDPGVGVADFFDGIGGQADEVGIPALRGGVIVRHAIAKLDEGVLDVPRLPLVVQVFGELLVGEMAAKPRIPPEQEWHEDD